MAKHKNGKKLDYFEAFEKQAELAIAEAKLLVEVIENHKGPDSLDDYIERAHEIEHAGDKLVHSVFDAVTVDFVTPIDREDIISLTQKLDDVLDYMEGTVQRFYMLDVKEMHPKAGEFAELLLKSCEKLGKALEDFDEFKNSKKINKLIIDVGSVEEEADELFFHTLRELYSHGEENPLYVFVWDKLFQRLENTADACEQAADTMGTIIMKNC